MSSSSSVVVSQVFSSAVVFVAWPFSLSFCFSAKLSVHLAAASPEEK